MAVARRRRHPLTVVAMVAGIAMGIALLALMRPGRMPDAKPSARPSARPSAEPAATVQAAPAPRELEVVRTPEVPQPERTPHHGPEVVDTGAVEALASFVVDVVDADGRTAPGGFAVPVDCPGMAPNRERGRFVAEAGACTLRAGRRDGALIARGDPVTVTLTAGEEAYVQLPLKAERTGGVGIRFEPAPGGMRVLDVVQGSAAWDAGLEVGDLIVGVEGVSTDRLPAQAFVGAMTGPEGSDVEFTVRFTTEEGVTDETVRVTRGFLDG